MCNSRCDSTMAISAHIKYLSIAAILECDIIESVVLYQHIRVGIGGTIFTDLNLALFSICPFRQSAVFPNWLKHTQSNIVQMVL